MVTSSDVIAASDSDFEQQVLHSELPVLVDFWAEWCGPCRMMSPIVEEVAKLYKGRLKVVTVDTEANPQTPQRFGVRGIPTFILFKNGELQSTRSGLMSKSQFTAFLDSNV